MGRAIVHSRWPAKTITKLRPAHLMPFKDVGSFVCELSAGPQYIGAKAKHQSAHSQNTFLRVRCGFRILQQLAPSGITTFLQPLSPLRKLGIKQAAAAAAAERGMTDFMEELARTAERDSDDHPFYLLHGLVALLRAAAGGSAPVLS